MAKLMSDQLRSESAERGRGFYNDVVTPEISATHNRCIKGAAPINGINKIYANDVRRSGVIEGEQRIKPGGIVDIQQTAI